ncbi:hypothetical protein D9M69_489380 [compost metagenome]
MHPAQRHLPPRAFARFPVQRRLDALLADPAPAVGEPQAGGLVAAVVDELEPLAVGDRVRAQRERLQVDLVARPLAVKGKALAAMADLDHAAVEADPVGRRARVGDHRLGQLRRKGRPQRILREQVQDVGQQQFLVLLLMLQAERDQRSLRVGLGAAKQRHHRLVHGLAVGQHLVQRRARQQSALRARMARADCFVIGVEQVAVVRVHRLIVGDARGQHEFLEEPGGVRQVPFRRAGVVHRLHGGIGIGQVGHQRLGAGADVAILRKQGGFVRRMEGGGGQQG